MRRASHSHHVPHVGFPHSEPTTSISAVNTTPTSADAPASRSQVVLRVRGTSHRIDASAVTPNARYASHAHGTCRYEQAHRLEALVLARRRDVQREDTR